MDSRANPDRHSFLHTPECNVLWREYLDCYKKHPFLRYWLDYCGSKYIRVATCFRKERQEKARNSIKESEKTRKKVVDQTIKRVLSSEVETD